jgi:hypothetical protein
MTDTLSSWVTVALPTGGTVTIYGKPESWPEWVKEMVRDEKTWKLQAQRSRPRLPAAHHRH